MTKYNLQSFRIDRKDFLKGNNVYDNYPSGGFLNSTVGVNVFSKPGLLAIPPSLPTAINTASPGTGFVGFGIGTGSSSAQSALGMYVDSATNYGYWTLITRTTGAHGTPTSDTGGRNYNYYQSDIVFYKTYFFASGASTICRIDSTNTTATGTWLTSTTDTRTGIAATVMTSNVPHPLLVFEDIMYIGDGQYLNKLDNTTYTSQVFDLPTGYVITAMVEFRGMIYMFAGYETFAGGTDLPGHSKCKIYSWDGLQNTWFEEYDIDYPVFSAFVWRNRLYAFTAEALCVWTGSELSPIYPVSTKVYKHQVTTTIDSVFFADGEYIIRFGTPQGVSGGPKFYRYLQGTSGVSFAGITSHYNKSLILSERNTGSKTYYISNVNTPDTAAVSKTFDLNPRFLKKPVFVRQIVIETEALASGQKVKCGYTNDQGTVVYPTYSSGEFDNATTEMAGKKIWTFDLFTKAATREILPRIVLTAGLHVKSVEYFYEGSEMKTNK